MKTNDKILGNDLGTRLVLKNPFVASVIFFFCVVSIPLVYSSPLFEKVFGDQAEIARWTIVSMGMFASIVAGIILIVALSNENNESH